MADIRGATVDQGPIPEQAAARVAEALRDGVCPAEAAFDRFYPYELRVVSGQYWTPLFVAIECARWLDDLGVRTVVDLGSGAGKFCIATALAGRSSFVGLEHRPRLIAAANVVARVFEVEDRVTFLEGAIADVELPQADAYYLYNPFGENLFTSDERLDPDVELGEQRYARDVEAVERMLARAPIGTHVLTYNGFGGLMPTGYRRMRTDRELPNVLHLWTKVSTGQ